ncbi:MAG: hypothetical protein R2834_21500 [Rhodothermales bacterium]
MKITPIVMLALALTSAGCDAVSSEDAAPAVAITTDSEAYTLERTAYGHRLAIRIEVANAGAEPVYLQRMCGNGSAPARSFERVPQTDVPVLLDNVACALPGGTTAMAPIYVAPGDRFIDDVVFESGFVREGRYTNRDTKTGTFRINYVVLTARRKRTQTLFEPMSEPYFSNAFEVSLAN